MAHPLAEAQVDVYAEKDAQHIILRKEYNFGVYAEGGTSRLAGDPSGVKYFAADDRLTLTATLANGQTITWQHDFRKDGAVVKLAPLDVTADLGLDLRSLEMAMEDLDPQLLAIRISG